MPRTPSPACRNCGKIPEPDLPHGLCARCLMVRLLDRPPGGDSAASENPAPPRRLGRLVPVAPVSLDDFNPPPSLPRPPSGQ
ncbi:MAG: hypothetical protein ABMA26_05485 [Limisphaerales bacterium]